MALMRADFGFSTGLVNGLLTGTRPEGHRPFYRPMLKDVVARIEERLKVVGLSASAASRQAGLSEDAIRNMKRAVEKDDRQGVSTTTIMALAPILQTTGSWLLEGGPMERDRLVPVVGRVGASPEGEVFFATGDSPNAWASAPPGAIGKPVALEVVGHSMRGLVDDGGLIYFEDQRTPPTPDMLGQVVVVETESDAVLVKRLLRGSEAGRFDLESLAGPTLRDVRVRWAAHITAIVPPYMAARIIRRTGEVS